MNIAILQYTAPPVVGGVENVVARHADLIANAGHQVRVIAAWDWFPSHLHRQHPSVVRLRDPEVAAAHPTHSLRQGFLP